MDESTGIAVVEYLRGIGHDVLAVVLEQHAHRLAGHFTVATEAGVRFRPPSELP